MCGSALCGSALCGPPRTLRRQGFVSESLAFAAIGLVSTWGEVFPRWVPVLAGRPVPGWAAAIPAALDREAEILRLIAHGRSYSEIAAELFIGSETVKTRVRNVLAKLGAKIRVQAVITAYESDFIRCGDRWQEPQEL